MKITIQLLLLLTVMISSCKPDLSNPEVEKLYKEVMIIHDEVMPEISTIHKLKKKIRKLDSNDNLSLKLLKELEDADESMMSWMADFGEFRKMDKATKDEKLKYLAIEKEKISVVSKKMKKAISDGNEFLISNN